MNLNSLSESEKLSLIEGYFCYPLKSGQNINNTLSFLIDYHEVCDYDLEEGLNYWHKDVGPRVRVECNWEFREKVIDKL